MKLLLVAVGQRQPAWADAAWDDFAKRFPPELRLELKAREGRAAQRRQDGRAVHGRRGAAPRGGAARRARAASCSTSTASAGTTLQLAERLRAWRGDGRDVALLIGGPDGLDAALKASADETLRLSDLTLPHAFVRVLLAEALYRAWSVTAGHPYHRE